MWNAIIGFLLGSVRSLAFREQFDGPLLALYKHTHLSRNQETNTQLCVCVLKCEAHVRHASIFWRAYVWFLEKLFRLVVLVYLYIFSSIYEYIWEYNLIYMHTYIFPCPLNDEFLFMISPLVVVTLTNTQTPIYPRHHRVHKCNNIDICYRRLLSRRVSTTHRCRVHCLRG